MQTLVCSEHAHLSTPEIAFVAGEWTFTGMHAPMCCESATGRVSKIAFFTCEWARVCSTLVRIDTSASSASKIALIASVWTLAGMNTFVSSERTFLRTLIITFFTCEWALARMNTLMLSEIIARRASKIAFVAGVRALASMHALVRTKITVLCTSIIALIAGEWTFT